MSTRSSISARGAVAGWIERLRPSSGLVMPEAASSGGVCSVPAATTVVSAVTKRRAPTPGGAAATARGGLDPGRAAAAQHDPARARAGVGDGAGGVGGVHVGLPGVLLGAGGAGEGAHARALAPDRVAVQEAARPAESLGAALGDARVGAGEVLGHALDADRALDARVDVVQRAGPERLEAELVAPALLHVGG